MDKRFCAQFTKSANVFVLKKSLLAVNLLLLTLLSTCFYACSSSRHNLAGSLNTNLNSEPQAYNATNTSADIDFPSATQEEFNSTGCLKLDTNRGRFSLFVVDNCSNPYKGASEAFDLKYDEQVGKLTVTTIPVFTENLIKRIPSLNSQALYFVLNYDNTLLTPTKVDCGDVLGGTGDVLNISVLREPGRVDVGLSRIASPNEKSDVFSIERGVLAFAVDFENTPFAIERKVSTVDDRRRITAPIDFMPIDNLDGSYILQWTERNIGDYDASGEVSIADITPIALNYLKLITDATNILELELYQQLDGDGSGDIGISDITPIANNYLSRIDGYDLWRTEDSESNAEWLVNLANPGLYNPDTASAPRPDPSTIPSERVGLAERYIYDSTTIQSKSAKKARKTPSALETAFYTIAKHEDGSDTTPPDVTLTELFGQTSIGSAEVNLSVEIGGNVARPFRLAILWDETLRPEIFENYNADGTDVQILHTYPSGGIFRPCVTLVSADGFAFSKRLSEINVNGPDAILTVSPDTGVTPLSVLLDASSSLPGDSPIDYYEWDFEGDGVFDENSGLNATIEHIYSSAGTFTPTVKVWDENGAYGAASQTVTVNATAQADLSADPLSGDPPLLVTFDSSLSTSPNGSITEHEWDWDGDLFFDETSGTEAVVQHIFEETGTFTVSVRVTDEIGAQDTAEVEISVTNEPPIAKISSDLNRGNVPFTVHFSAAGSGDPNGEIVRYEWDLDGDGTFEYNSGIEQTAIYTYEESGDYTVSLMVTDGNDATDTASMVVTAIIRPVAVADANPKTGNAPLLVDFSSEGSYDPDGVITQYKWDFDGDGTFEWSSTTTGNTQHTYETGGTKNARLRVFDDDNATATTTVVLDINSAPVIDLEADITVGEPPLLVNFDASGSYDPDGSIVRYEWDWEDDGIFDLDTDLDPKASHEFTDDGSFLVVCRATDDLGAMGTGTIRISINNIPPIAVAGADVTTGDKPLTVNLNADGSSDPDGTLTYWEWDFEGDGTYDWSSDVNGNVQHEYNDRGSFMATLRVTDNDATTSTDDIEIYINDWQFYSFTEQSMGETSLEIDSNDHPHIVFVSDSLRYTYYDGTDWVMEVINPVTGDSMYPSLELDSNGYPHVCYYTATSQDLIYAYNIGAGWIFRTADSGGDVGQYASLDLDSDDYPHISYALLVGGQNPSSSLKHASYNGSSWTVQTVDGSGLPGFGTSIQADSNKRSHIAYFAAADGDLRYAYYNGSSWVKSTIESTGMVGWYPSLILDSSDHGRICYFDNTNGDLKYGQYDGSSWSIEIVDSDNITGYYCSLALDSTETPHISYCYYSNNDLKYATLNGAVWDKEIVDDDGMDGWFTSIGLGSNNKPHISYCDNGLLGYVYLE